MLEKQRKREEIEQEVWDHKLEKLVTEGRENWEGSDDEEIINEK